MDLNMVIIYRRGVNKTNFIVTFQGYGEIGIQSIKGSLDRAYKFSNTQHGSSKVWNQTFSKQNDGILSGNISINPNYHDWTKIFVKYCDGTLNQGSLQHPILYKGKYLYFRGINNTNAVIKTIQKNHGVFTKSNIVIFHGVSSGGISLLFHCDNLVSKVKSGKAYCVSDSAVYLQLNSAKRYIPRYKYVFKNIVHLVNSQTRIPNSQCMKQNFHQQWKCFISSNLVKYVKSKLFFISALYDLTQIHYHQQIQCVQYHFPNFTTCNSSERGLIQRGRKNIQKQIEIILRNKQNGVWAIACPQHGFSYWDAFDSEDWKVPGGTGLTSDQAMTNWIFNKTESHIHIDKVSWPQNKKCASTPYYFSKKK